MTVFALQLVVYGLHEFAEANAIPDIDNARWHAAAEVFAGGLFAQLISLALVIVPTVWLAATQWQNQRGKVSALTPKS